MEQQVLKTKLFMPPLRQKIVHRQRLLERFRDALEQKVMLIVAPAGYGKTVLLCNGLQNNQMPVAWLTLDEDDNDPTRFWLHVISAIQSIQDDIGKSVFKLLESKQTPNMKYIITNIINEVSETNKEFSLVLDDFHTIQSEKIQSDLTYLIEHLPPQIHLVIASRSYPKLPLARLRGCGLLTEFNTDDLAFNKEETTAFFNDIMALGLSGDDIANLEFFTEGWIAGLQMAAMSMKGRDNISMFIASFHNYSQYIMDYLIEEVLRKQETKTLSFLLDTAILDRFTASLCNAVTGRDDGREILERIDSANLFLVPLDNEHKWYRYHHLFADLLRKKLLQYQETYVAKLHLKASNWFAKKGLISEAINHALNAEDFDRAASLIEESVMIAVSAGRVTTLLKWFEKLPQEAFTKWPRLSIYHAWVTLLIGNINSAEKMLLDVRGTLESMPYSSENNLLLGQLASLLTLIATHRCDTAKATEEANEALTWLPDNQLIPRARIIMVLGHISEFHGDIEDSIKLYKETKDMAIKGNNNFLAASSTGYLAAALIRRGRLTEATKLFQRIIELDEQHEIIEFPPAGIGFVGLAWISLERNNIQTALHNIDKGVELCELMGLNYYLMTAYYTKAYIKLATGDRGAALDGLYQIEQIYTPESPPTVAFLMAEYQARIRLLLNDLESALYWVKDFPDTVREKMPEKTVPYVQHEIQYILLSKVYNAMSKHEEAIEICNQIRSDVESRGHVGRLIDIGMTEAIAMYAKGKMAKALNIIDCTLSLTEPEGYIHSFVNEGEPMHRLLQEAASHGIKPKYATELLTAFKESNSKFPNALLFPEQPSKREIEVLRLIESGMSNKMIAEELVVSESTIKTHINNLYSKLDVQSRTQAIVRAKELNLL